MNNNLKILRYKSRQNGEIYNFDEKIDTFVSDQTLQKCSLFEHIANGIFIQSIKWYDQIIDFTNSKLFVGDVEIGFQGISLRNKELFIISNNSRLVNLNDVRFITRVSKNRLKTLEKEIRVKCPHDIRIGNFFKKEVANIDLETFLVRFLQTYNKEKATIFVETKREYTAPGKRRSLSDLFFICKYYFPQVTFKEFLICLYTKILTKSGFRTSYCTQTQKRMYYYDGQREQALLNSETLDEFGFFAEDYFIIINDED